MAASSESPWARRSATALALMGTFAAGWYAGGERGAPSAKPRAESVESRDTEPRNARVSARSEEHVRLEQCETLLGDFGDACLTPLPVEGSSHAAACSSQIEQLRQRAESAVALEFLIAARNAHEAGAFRTSPSRARVTGTRSTQSAGERVLTTAAPGATPPRDYAAALRARFEGED